MANISNPLECEIRRAPKMAVALSGGLDSCVLLRVAADILGAENCLALTAVSAYMSKREIGEAEEFCSSAGIRHVKIFADDVFEAIKSNPADRCYLCKMRLFSKLKSEAEKLGFPRLCDGTNADDLSDYRPGMAALKELEIESPFLKASIGKGQIRGLARKYNLSCSQKSAYACLMTRFETGAKVDTTLLERVEKAEGMLIEAGFDGVRVRVHCGGGLARIELANNSSLTNNIDKLAGLSEDIRRLGFKFVCLDMHGYVRGNMNHTKNLS